MNHNEVELNIDPNQIDYKALYENEKNIRLQLEQDCDLLSLENIRLNEEVNRLKDKISITKFQQLNIPSHHDDNVDGQKDMIECQVELVLPSSNISNLPSSSTVTINNACNKTNVICSCFCNNDEFILCAGADNSINLYSINSNQDMMERKWTSKLSAPVTSMASSNQITVCGMLDGSFALVSIINKS